MAHGADENTVVGLTVDALVSNNGWARVGGTSIPNALSDGSDSSYLVGNNLADKVTVGWTSVTVPALTQLRTAYILARGDSNPQAYLQFSVPIGPHVFDGQVFMSDYLATRAWDSTELVVDYRPTQADIDGITAEMGIAAFQAGADAVAVAGIALELYFNQAPTVSNIRPSAYGTSPNMVVTWDYSDPEKNAQDYSLVKAFSLAQYTAVGFNPDSSVATYSAEVRSTAQSRTIPFLANGRYRIYVKVADIDSSKRYGPWSFVEIEVRNRYIQSVV